MRWYGDDRMATYTTNYNLKKPSASDTVDIADINGNMDIIDNALNVGVASVTEYFGASASVSTEPDTPLPAGYIPVEYIEGAGSGAVKTNYVHSTGVRLEYKISMSTTATDCAIFGVADTGGSRVSVRAQIVSDASRFKFWSGKADVTGSTWTANTPTEYEVNIVVGTSTLKSGETTLLSVYQSGVTTQQDPWWLMGEGYKATNSISAGFKGKMYYFRIYDTQDNLLHNYVPCRTTSTVGFFDLVTGDYLPTTTASGTLTAGPDLTGVYSTQVPTLTASVPYLWHFVRVVKKDGTIADTTHAIIDQFMPSVDSAPTSASDNLVKSGGVYTALQGYVPKPNLLQGQIRMLAYNGPNQMLYAGAYDPTGGTIPIREGSTGGNYKTGCIKVEAPSLDKHATNKEYVDALIPKIISNTSVSSWSADNTYSDYGYRASVAITGVTASDVAEIIFGASEAVSGDYAPICETYAGGVYIYSAVNDSITIPTIIVFKG